MKDDRLYLHHRLERYRRIKRFIGTGRGVSPDVRGRLAALDWKAICGMRDVLIHDYIGVDLDEVWNVASSRMPELQAALEHFLAGSQNVGPAQ